MREVVVTRSALRMWFVALAGVGLLIVAFDALIGGTILPAFGRLVYGTEDAPLDGGELAVWSFALLVLGAGLAGMGIRDLVAPRRILHADEHGLRLAVTGPRGPAAELSWADVVDVRCEPLPSPDGPVPALFLVVGDPERLPLSPWGAVWVDHWTIALPAGDWAWPPAEVAARLEGLRRAGQGLI